MESVRSEGDSYSIKLRSNIFEFYAVHGVPIIIVPNNYNIIFVDMHIYVYSFHSRPLVTLTLSEYIYTIL